jgi:hypothetical protein
MLDQTLDLELEELEHAEGVWHGWPRSSAVTPRTQDRER